MLLRNGEAAEVAMDAAGQSDPQSHEPIFTVTPTYFDVSGAPYAWDNIMRISSDPETGQGQIAVNTLEIGCFEGAASRYVRVIQCVPCAMCHRASDPDNSATTNIRTISFPLPKPTSFMLQKWLSHKDSRLTCIDTFQGSPEHLAAGD